MAGAPRVAVDDRSGQDGLASGLSSGLVTGAVVGAPDGPELLVELLQAPTARAEARISRASRDLKGASSGYGVPVHGRSVAVRGALATPATECCKALAKPAKPQRPAPFPIAGNAWSERPAGSSAVAPASVGEPALASAFR